MMEQTECRRHTLQAFRAHVTAPSRRVPAAIPPVADHRNLLESTRDLETVHVCPTVRGSGTDQSMFDRRRSSTLAWEGPISLRIGLRVSRAGGTFRWMADPRRTLRRGVDDFEGPNRRDPSPRRRRAGGVRRGHRRHLCPIRRREPPGATGPSPAASFEPEHKLSRLTVSLNGIARYSAPTSVPPAWSSPTSTPTAIRRSFRSAGPESGSARTRSGTCSLGQDRTRAARLRQPAVRGSDRSPLVARIDEDPLSRSVAPRSGRASTSHTTARPSTSDRTSLIGPYRCSDWRWPPRRRREYRGGHLQRPDVDLRPWWRPQQFATPSEGCTVVAIGETDEHAGRRSSSRTKTRTRPRRRHQRRE